MNSSRIVENSQNNSITIENSNINITNMNLNQTANNLNNHNTSGKNLFTVNKKSTRNLNTNPSDLANDKEKKDKENHEMNDKMKSSEIITITNIDENRNF